MLRLDIEKPSKGLSPNFSGNTGKFKGINFLLLPLVQVLLFYSSFLMFSMEIEAN